MKGYNYYLITLKQKLKLLTNLLKTMKKIIYGVLAITLFSFSNSANAQMEIKGANFINLGLGIGVAPTSIGFNASYEHGFFRDISIGGIFDFRTGNHTYYSNYDEKFNEIGLGFRGSYHFNRLMRIKQKNVDIYAGAVTGLYITSYNYNDNYSYHNPNATNIMIGVHAGAKIFVSDHFGFFGELSSYNSILKAGIALKF